MLSRLTNAFVIVSYVAKNRCELAITKCTNARLGLPESNDVQCGDMSLKDLVFCSLRTQAVTRYDIPMLLSYNDVFLCSMNGPALKRVHHIDFLLPVLTSRLHHL